MTLMPICQVCRLRATTPGQWTCEAFPAGIPQDILDSDFDHRQPKGAEAVFSPEDASADEYAALLFDEGS